MNKCTYLAYQATHVVILIIFVRRIKQVVPSLALSIEHTSMCHVSTATRVMMWRQQCIHLRASAAYIPREASLHIT